MSRASLDAGDPASIIRLGMSFGVSKVVLTAVELGLFDLLSGKPATAAEICGALELHPRGVPHFLDVLVVTGLLERVDGHYGNTAAAENFLVRANGSFAGGFLYRANHNLYPAFGKLTEALRTGQPQVETEYTEMIKDPAVLRRFLDMMDSLTTLLGPGLAEAYDWASRKTILDVGGARGHVLSYVLGAAPQAQGIVFDLPEDAEPFAEHMAELGLSDRARFHAGSFLTDDLPAADAVIIGHVLHDWAPEERQMLVHKAYAALPPGGVLVVYDPMVDEGLTHPENLFASLSMLLTTPGGAEYPPEECQAWMGKAGFGRTEVKPLGPNDTVVIAYKDER
ncbi:methyltransferase [Amycolatopsis sp. NPDC021455]|uniref:methyltransferase n=1 Tax=Amycolatopsis sp. NPDC021455 TaxID=3154901 RepID=UPI0034016B97